jgi:hypothetical protein
VDRLDRLGDAVVIARRSLRIGAQSVTVGIGLSLVAMVVAALGHLPPTWGALLQEAIDVVVIVNALRALQPAGAPARLTAESDALARRFQAEHLALRGELDRIRIAADRIDPTDPVGSIAGVRAAHRFLVEELGPHEDAEDRELYPTLAATLGGHDPTATMSRAHVEIAHLIRRLGRVLADLAPTPSADIAEAARDAQAQAHARTQTHAHAHAQANPTLDEHDAAELRRLLYGVHAILVLHFAQEDESYLSLADDAPGDGSGPSPLPPAGAPAGD